MPKYGLEDVEGTSSFVFAMLPAAHQSSTTFAALLRLKAYVARNQAAVSCTALKYMYHTQDKEAIEPFCRGTGIVAKPARR
jgi:hypothetical protein